MSKAPVRVAVTGAAGQIGYSLLFRIASGEMLGKDQPVILQLLEIPDEKAQKALKGVMMELDDCAFPLLAGMSAHSRPEGRVQGRRRRAARRRPPARPRHGAQGPAVGQRADLHRAGQGARRGRRPRRQGAGGRQPGEHQRLHRDEERARACRATNFTAMLRLDHNRALSQLAAKTGKPVDSIEKLVVWGNHSPDDVSGLPLRHRRRPARRQGSINDEAWYRDTFIPTVGKRGAAIIEARGLSSAASAANAAIDHVRDWVLGTNGKWVTMGVPSERRLRHPAGRDVRHPGHLRQRQVRAGQGPGDRRVQPRQRWTTR